MGPDAVFSDRYLPQDQLFVWALINPARPAWVGTLQLSPLVADCATFRYQDAWWQLALSEDLPLQHGHVFSAGERGSAPGALDDARPDRWGERVIRFVDRPARLSILEMLLFAGDDRFGALGVSVSAQQYLPRRLGPYPILAQLAELDVALEAVQTQDPVSTLMRRLVQPGATLGGAQPKALLQTDSGPCIVKFSELGDAVDSPLIEHASMTLARQAGIRVADTRVLSLPLRHGKARHALLVERFDRRGGYRVHCLSARTLLRAADLPQSYGALASVLWRLGHPERQIGMREELFRRLVFNILIDNTDDHERNHSARLELDGYYDLSPAYDVLPALQNLGYQALEVGRAGAESSLDNALSALNDFGLKRPRALELIREVARKVEGWAGHFIRLGVCDADMELLRASIDRDALRQQRRAYV